VTSHDFAFSAAECSYTSLTSSEASWGPNHLYVLSSAMLNIAKRTVWSTAHLDDFWSPATLYSTRGAWNHATSVQSSNTTARTTHPRHQTHPPLPLLPLPLHNRPNLLTLALTPNHQHNWHARSAPPVRRFAMTTCGTPSRRTVHNRTLQNTRA
jgi:hypothetical protein